MKAAALRKVHSWCRANSSYLSLPLLNMLTKRFSSHTNVTLLRPKFWCSSHIQIPHFSLVSHSGHHISRARLNIRSLRLAWTCFMHRLDVHTKSATHDQTVFCYSGAFAFEHIKQASTTFTVFTWKDQDFGTFFFISTKLAMASNYCRNNLINEWKLRELLRKWFRTFFEGQILALQYFRFTSLKKTVGTRVDLITEGMLHYIEDKMDFSLAFFFLEAPRHNFVARKPVAFFQSMFIY